MGPQEIAEAALACFQRGGYRLTQIAHVSERLGVSVGAIYRYVDSKEALFHLAVLEAVGGLSDSSQPLPVHVTGLQDTVALIGDVAARDGVWPVLEAALKGPAPDDLRAEARRIGAELYDSIARRADLISLLDRCAQDIPALAELFDNAVRRRLMGDLIAWVVRRPSAGVTVATAEALTRGAMEAVAWLAKTRRGDTTADGITEAQAREAAIRIFANAFG